MRTLTLAAALLTASPALAHDYWSNGEPVPAGVKASCCGPADVHRLKPSAVHIQADGYHIDGLSTVIPISRAQPSPDGSYWAFFPNASGPDAPIYCFFAPLNGV